MPADAEEFEALRGHLLRVGYRVTGSIADAEDAVQDAWLRWSGMSDAERARVRDLRAFLTTAVARLCLDRLRSAAAHRERYVGPWLPEPLVTTGPDDPLAAVVQDEGVRMAAMLVLERLTPPQRVALVLHEALDLPYAAIAEVLGCPEATARQYAARARRIVADAAPPPPADAAEQAAVLDAFAAALARGDQAALVELLHPDAVYVADSGGAAKAARRPVVGADKITRLLLGLLEAYGPALATGWTPVLVNGDLGLAAPADGDLPAGVVTVAVSEGRIAGIYQVVNPAKLAPGRPRRSPGR
ncbi:RNA polymerase sigma-70 factor, ECF subfamily [Pseudonocardia thermophila]|uniref:RNA polymerase sigma-70 factor, ECF subfamily n=1 Tax=Pseudonocardia thermophila TaxID=1848 RepID=A0A1M6PE53_PSETH|nr:RNA polymerase sigma factor SigJ [Pseudonocardia thermophila]SHK06216.1 RNA polymerase sigma-70 factor, ECF subfamily [Pseudonocardia thermophila]